LKKTRRFKGKEYRLMASGTSKYRARNDASILRRRGYSVRILYQKGNKGVLPKWLIYGRRQ